MAASMVVLMREGRKQGKVRRVFLDKCRLLSGANFQLEVKMSTKRQAQPPIPPTWPTTTINNNNNRRR
jgi:hypothetical protein